MNFLRMNRQRQNVCPTGYIWATNIHQNDMDLFIGILFSSHEDGSYYKNTLDTYRKQYGDVQIVTPAYDNLGNELKDGNVAIYVPHPAIRRINRWLRNHNKMKGGNLPY